MNTLKLTLNKKWFDLIKEGIKTEEYREIKSYWFERLVFQYEKAFKYCTGYEYKQQLYVNEGIQHTLSESKKSMVAMKPFEAVEFTNGYNSKSPKITLIIDAIFIGEGKEEWGAVKGQRYFVFKLGREVGRQNC